MKKNLRWELYKFFSNKLMLWGFHHDCIEPYDSELIEKMRTIHYGGVPASIILLCNALSNGKCYDRALLMSRVFLNDPGDVKLIYASIADLRLKPDSREPDHCFVERITEEGKHLIYDTSTGFVYNKWIYWLISRPRIRKINDKVAIKDYLETEEPEWTHDGEFLLNLVIPSVEMTYGKKDEFYSAPGIELLQREVELFREKVKNKIPPYD